MWNWMIFFSFVLLLFEKKSLLRYKNIKQKKRSDADGLTW